MLLHVIAGPLSNLAYALDKYGESVASKVKEVCVHTGICGYA
jgi:inosine-uridine nucleoside N-ribohydrolase